METLRPQEGFGGRLQLWASSLLCLFAGLHEGLACLQAEGPPLPWLSPGLGEPEPWGALTSCTSPCAPRGTHAGSTGLRHSSLQALGSPGRQWACIRVAPGITVQGWAWGPGRGSLPCP